MPPKRRINFKGREVDGTPVTATQSSEYWNQYLLDDGSIIRMKLVATEFARVDGEYDNEGNPVYVIRSTNVVACQAPEELRKH